MFSGRPQEPIRLLCSWDFPGNSTGVDCHFLLQWIFPTRDRTLVSWVSCFSKQTVYRWAHSCICTIVSIETQKEGVHRAPGLVSARPPGSADSRVALTAHALSPYLVQQITSIRLGHVNNLRRQIFLWVLEWSSKLVKLQEGVPDSNLNQDPLKRLSVSKGNYKGYFKDSIGE